MDTSNAIHVYALAGRILLFSRNRQSFSNRRVIHPGGPVSARRRAAAFLAGSNTQFMDLFRLSKPQFRVLLQWLQRHCGLRGTRYQTAEMKLIIVLWIFAFSEPQRNAAHLFGVTQSSVSRTVTMLLPMFLSLHTAFVRLPPDDWLDETIEGDPKNSAFNGCIGAVDGTHIAAFVRGTNERNRWRGRYGHPTQNVFAAVRQDYSFSYVLAGAEGSLNDSLLASQAFGRSFRVPRDRYYLSDAGFGVRQGIVVPFPGTRYHLNDWQEATNRPSNAKELYNLRHARLRVVVEQAFGMLKRRWKIVRIAPFEYSIRKQVMVVYAVTALHNFIIAQAGDDVPAPRGDDLLEAARARARRTVAERHPDYVRATTARALWAEYQRYLARRE